MTKHKRLFLLVGVACGLVATNGWAHGNAQGKTQAKVGSATVAIEYGRPTLKGRDMMKQIQPGQIWRLGADIPTTIESDADLDFGGVRVPKGKHILLARLVEAGHWSLMVSSKPAAHYEASDKLAEVPMEMTDLADPVDELTVTLTSQGGQGRIEVAWGGHRLTASFAAARPSGE